MIEEGKVNYKNTIVILILIVLIFLVCGCLSTSPSTNAPRKTAINNPTVIKFFTKTPQMTPTHSYYAKGTVIVDLCNLRQGPGTNYPVIGYSEKGKAHKIFGVNSEKTWLLLDENKSIWIALSLISLDTDISNIPVINNLSFLDSFVSIEERNQQINVTPIPSYLDPNPTQSFIEPEPTQFEGCPYGCTYHPPGCDIKGNISYRNGEKIYHVPGGDFYNDCVINPKYGERWFCTEQEAINNGWRKSEH